MVDLILNKLSTRSQEVMSLWWGVCDGVISLISQSSVDPTAVWAACYNKKTPWTCVTYTHLSPIRQDTHTRSHTQTHTDLNIPREQWDGAVKWGGLVTLSGDVWGFSQVDDEPQGASGREKRGERREKRPGRKDRRANTEETNESVQKWRRTGKKLEKETEEVVATYH